MKTYISKLLQFIGKPFFYLLLFFISSLYISYRAFRLLNLKITLLTIIIATSWFGYQNLKTILQDLPSPEELSSKGSEFSTKIYDRNGTLLYTIYKDENRQPIKFAEIPNHVILAFLAAEDANFFHHHGFSPKGMTRAIFKYLTSGQITGGSTITQQLVKNTLLTPEKTLPRKLKEIVLAIRVEQKYTKTQILQMYLNEAAFGGVTYGIKQAANTYFNKEVKDLTLAEAALLAGLPQSPTKYNPFGSSPELALNRQKEILNAMAEDGFITPEEAQKAKDEKLIFAPNQNQLLAPHFVMYVRELLVDQLGEEQVEKGGLEVVTTLDLNLNQQVEKIIQTEVNALTKLNVGNGAALVINPQNGEILSMVGSKNYFDNTNDGNVNVLTRLRQPGSTIKLVNYSYALEHGYTLATIIDDSPTAFPLPGHAPYIPKNYDNKFKGKISLRDAFAQSRNIPAVKVLNSYGVENMINQGEKMGITSWTDPNRFGLSLTLGGGEVYLTDLTQAYATVANYGQKVALNPILSITDHDGNKIKIKTEEPTQALNPQTAFLIISTLSDNKARTPAFGPNSLLNIKGHPEVAVKTGTSNSLRDNLAIGFNQNYLVAAWVGNNDSTPMSAVASGITGATPIWNHIMTYLLQNTESKPWNVPQGIVKISTCNSTEFFTQGTQPKINCTSLTNSQTEQ